MGEYYPVIDTNGRVKEFINSGADVISILRDEGEFFFFWNGLHEGIDVTGLIGSEKKLSVPYEGGIYIYALLDPSPTLYGYVAYDIDEYVSFLREKVSKKLNGKKVLLSFSGGKDSIASLAVLLKLQEYVSFKLFIVYSYVSYLEAVRNDRFIDEVEKKLSLDIVRVETPRETMRRILLDTGLPFRGYRWCTYLKIKPIRAFRRRNGIDFEISNERLFETSKRFKSLVTYARQKIFISGGRFKPIYPLALLDVVKICRDRNLVHPDYLEGFSRVSCALCPYRMLYEVKDGIKDVEDPGLIEKALKIGYEKFYQGKVSWEDYMEYELWRFHPDRAKLFIALREFLSEQIKIREFKRISEESVREKFRSIWIRNLPQNPRISLRNLYDMVREWSKIATYSVINPPWS